MKRLDLVIGPNGAGKSTFIAVTLAPLLARSVVVNADEIARQRWPDDSAAHAYDAARVASATRSTLITSQLPVKAWHTYLNDPTLADAILDRVVHSSHKIELKAGKSMRDTEGGAQPGVTRDGRDA